MKIRSSIVSRQEIKQWNDQETRRLDFPGRELNGRGFIYALEDPHLEVVRYIGATAVDPFTRLQDHLNPSTPTPVAREWISLLRNKGLYPRFRMLRVVPLEDLHAFEEKLIRKFSRNRCLLNVVHHPYGHRWPRPKKSV